MSDIVIREVAHGLVTFSRPFPRYSLIPIGGRSTAIRLRNGDVWVLASTPLTSETKSTIDALGPVKYIVSADAVHWLFVEEFKKAYPSAKVYAPNDAVKKMPADIEFTGVWGRDVPETKYEFEAEIQAVYFSGFKNRDIAFFHADTKTLIQADLLFNLPAKEQYSIAGQSLFPFVSLLSPFTWLHSNLIKGMAENKEAMKRDAKIVSSFDFDRIIPCHGDVIETNGKKAWDYAYRAFLAA